MVSDRLAVGSISIRQMSDGANSGDVLIEPIDGDLPGRGIRTVWRQFDRCTLDGSGVVRFRRISSLLPASGCCLHMTDPTELLPTDPIEPPRQSPWSMRAKVGRLLWVWLSFLLWSRTPHSWHGLRCQILRAFGARIGRRCRLAPSVRIEVPWNLQLGDDVVICDHAILYCLGQVTIGEGTLIGPFVHMCAGTHDHTDPDFTLLRSPITVGPSCCVLTASFIGPGVTLAARTVAKERSSLLTDTEADGVYRGAPARRIDGVST